MIVSVRHVTGCESLLRVRVSKKNLSPITQLFGGVHSFATLFQYRFSLRKFISGMGK